jgi:flagellar motor switch protein FliG
MKPQNQTMTGLRKAAILLVLLGEEVSSQVYAALPPIELQRLTQEIADLGYISKEMAAVVLKEFNQLAITQEYLAQGGPDYAHKLLVKAFGEDEAQNILAQVTLAQEESASNFEYLQKADPEQLAKFVQEEHPQTVAVVLAHLGPKVASRLLVLLPEATRAMAMSRLAEMRPFSPEFVNTISLVLHRKVGALGRQSRRSFGGVKVVAELLNMIDQNSSKIVLENIEQDNPQMAVSIRNLMFTFEDFLTVADDGIRELLGQCDKKTIAMALRGASEDLRNHFFRSMSSRAVQMLQEDMEMLGPVRGKDVAKAQAETVEMARKLEASGKIMLKADSSDELVVG